MRFNAKCSGQTLGVEGIGRAGNAVLRRWALNKAEVTRHELHGILWGLPLLEGGAQPGVHGVAAFGWGLGVLVLHAVLW